jgi:hypothetical protein
VIWKAKVNFLKGFKKGAIHHRFILTDFTNSFLSSQCKNSKTAMLTLAKGIARPRENSTHFA